LIVPLDGSELAERAMPLAAALAQASGDEIEFVHVLGSPADEASYFGFQTGAFDSAQFEAEVTALARQHNLAASSTLASGRPSEFIVHEAQRPGARAVVMASHGRTGIRRAYLGSVAEQVVRASPIPVLLMPAKAPAPVSPWRPSRIVVPVDGSALSEAVLPLAADIAHKFSAQVKLLRVYPVPEDVVVDHARNVVEPIDVQMDQTRSGAHRYFEPLLAGLERLHVTGHAETAFGEPVATILETAKRMAADLIVMTTHGRSGLARLFAGSVAEGVLRGSRVPLVLLGQAALNGDETPSGGHSSSRKAVAA
jgi:nucleotide-binding universal stress UspA family protein